MGEYFDFQSYLAYAHAQVAQSLGIPYHLIEAGRDPRLPWFLQNEPADTELSKTADRFHGLCNVMAIMDAARKHRAIKRMFGH